MTMLPDSTPELFKGQTYCSQVHPARISASPESGSPLKESGDTSPSSARSSSTDSNQISLLSKTCLAGCLPKETHSDGSSDCWWERIPHSFRQMASNGPVRVWLLDPGEEPVGPLSTVNFGLWRNGASVCTLSQVLEKNVPRKYYLTPRACAGILRRAEKRGKKLPPQLEAVLRAVAAQDTKQPRPSVPETKAAAD